MTVSLLLFCAPTLKSAAVRDGGFDRIEVNVPDEVTAGKEFETVVSFLDNSGKMVPDDWEPSTSLSLVISKPGSVLPPILTPEKFHPISRFKVLTDHTGQLEMTLVDNNGQILKKWVLNVLPGPEAGGTGHGFGSNIMGKTTSTPTTVPGTETEAEKRMTDRNSPVTGVLDAVVVNESDSRCVVSFSTNGVVSYDVYTSTEQSRKWINIVLHNVISKLPEHLEGGEDIVGEVSLQRREKDNKVEISLEILPLKIGYELLQKRDSLILEIDRR